MAESFQADMHIKEYTEAIRLNHDLAEAYNNNDCILMRRLSGLYCGRGNAYNAKKDYDRAIADLNEAIRLNPDFVEARENLEKVKEKLGR